MKTQPETLRLADDLNYVARYVDSEHWDTFAKTADELRRLHEAHEWQYTMAGQRLRRIEKLEAINQELLAALKDLINCGDPHRDWEELKAARAAIAKAERTTT